jgi:uncharacterized protein
VQKSVEIINSLDADLILLGGDFIYSYPEQIDYFYPFANAKSKYGIYSVLGNHDYGVSRNNRFDNKTSTSIQKSDYVATKLEEFSIQVLRNNHISLEVDNNVVTIVGLEDLWGNRFDFNTAIENIPNSDLILMLQHNPDIISDQRSNIADLVLSGHTHGGQICLPIIGAIGKIPTQLGQKYDYGLFEFDTKLYISKGIGEMGPRARLYCRPEIVLLEIIY